jgi:hypothetical protein
MPLRDVQRTDGFFELSPFGFRGSGKVVWRRAVSILCIHNFLLNDCKQIQLFLANEHVSDRLLRQAEHKIKARSLEAHFGILWYLGALIYDNNIPDQPSRGTVAGTPIGQITPGVSSWGLYISSCLPMMTKQCATADCPINKDE